MKILLSLVLTLLLASCEVTDVYPNFHTVDKGQLYRSAQLNKKQFKHFIKEYDIKTVINLRGASPGRDWYEDEKEVMQELGITHVDIKMSAKRMPHKKDLIELLNQFETAERPILIHCQGGADRTGEASAIYHMEYLGASKKKALKMLRVRYGHLKKRYPAKRYFIKEVWQGSEWAKNEYDPCAVEYPHYDQSKYCKGLEPEEVVTEEDPEWDN